MNRWLTFSQEELSRLDRWNIAFLSITFPSLWVLQEKTRLLHLSDLDVKQSMTSTLHPEVADQESHGRWVSALVDPVMSTNNHENFLLPTTLHSWVRYYPNVNKPQTVRRFRHPSMYLWAFRRIKLEQAPDALHLQASLDFPTMCIVLWMQRVHVFCLAKPFGTYTLVTYAMVWSGRRSETKTWFEMKACAFIMAAAFSFNGAWGPTLSPAPSDRI